MGVFVRNCRLCHEPMSSSPFTMCPTCLDVSAKVRQFVGKNPQVSIEEISQATKVPLDKIKRLIHLGLNKKSNEETKI
ncbi:hypothetical protein DX933_00235 [Ornithinibacillus gellani]|uniref:hypothetical protein n=1 Tax=Ornithinibacillus gellani TaxID=2293253 RepID=UPI000F49F056|nr:hypothetical protein [Ornithinibacillus gellani]TQS76572.1 hypothetical protein DX933_00235 [Ornithinibacillus gellani]